MSDVALVILAAGEGKRMQDELHNDLPKVLQPLHHRPLVTHLIHSVEGAPIAWPPVIVIGYHGDAVKDALGDGFVYVWQKEQLGTGHAVAQTRDTLQGKAKHILVLYGDHPHIPLEVVKRIIETHKDNDNAITLATTIVENYSDWNKQLKHYGRIVRDSDRKVERIVEYKDATAEEREIKELNPSYYCFNADWLWEHIDTISNKNAQGEYYLTDLLQMAIEEKQKVECVPVEPMVAMGANTVEELHQLEKLLPQINGNGNGLA